MSHEKRNVNLDVFRCLAMFLVVLGHVWQHGSAFTKTPEAEMLIWGGLRWHVDVFCALTGWFGLTFTFRKFFRIYGIVAFWCIVGIGVALAVGEKPRLMLTGGWYADTYLCLMLIITFVNAAIEKLRERGLAALWSAWGGFAIVIFYNWATKNSYLGLVAWDVIPFSLIQMVFIYFTVRNVRFLIDDKLGIGGERLLHLICWLSVGAFVLITCGCIVMVHYRGPSEALMQRISYMAPHVILMAVAMLVLFDRYIKCPLWVGRICVWMAPSMFSVYVIHGLPVCSRFFRDAPAHWLLKRGDNQWGALGVGAIVCFVLCISADLLLRRSVFKFVKTLWVRNHEKRV